MTAFVCAVDVGTGSARAGIFDTTGKLYGRAEAPLATRRPAPGEGEHDSEQIWGAVGEAVRAARAGAGVAAEAVCAIAFDATCSLVVRARNGAQLPVSGPSEWDTIAWFDHRALAEADECTATGNEALAYVGGRMSPEMQIPKLMWLKRRMPETWRAAACICDLADFLAWRASGSITRSQSTLTCKWGYRPDRSEPWPKEFLHRIGLADMIERAGLKCSVAPAGTDIGCLTHQAAGDLGLSAQCRVGAGLIDAYAGALGVLGGQATGRLAEEAALIGGTSSCVMFASDTPRHLPAAWGPFFAAALPAFWMSEAGQSATGALLDHLLLMGGHEPSPEMHARLVSRVQELRAARDADFAARLHVLPDFNGNRAPSADPHALGVISGLALDASFEGLCALYWRSCVGIALGVRQIVEHLNGSGRAIRVLHIGGGHVKNPLLMELYADATGCTIVEPTSPDIVLLGTANVAATAAGLHGDLAAAARAMSRPGTPHSPNRAANYDRDYAIFLEMQRHRKAVDALAAGG